MNTPLASGPSRRVPPRVRRALFIQPSPCVQRRFPRPVPGGILLLPLMLGACIPLRVQSVREPTAAVPEASSPAPTPEPVWSAPPLEVDRLYQAHPGMLLGVADVCDSDPEIRNTAALEQAKGSLIRSIQVSVASALVWQREETRGTEAPAQYQERFCRQLVTYAEAWLGTVRQETLVTYPSAKNVPCVRILVLKPLEEWRRESTRLPALDTLSPEALEERLASFLTDPTWTRFGLSRQPTAAELKTFCEQEGPPR